MNNLLTLPGRHGTLDIHIAVRPAGEVAFQIASARMAGTVVFRPCPLPGQAVPDAVVVRFGDGDSVLADQLTDRPVLDGLRLLGGGVTMLERMDWLATIDPVHRHGGRLTAIPRRSARYLDAVLSVLADQYRAMNPHQLALAAARATANDRLGTLVHTQLLPTARLAATARGELTELHNLAGRLQQLSPLRLAGVPAQCEPAWPQVHPDTVITAVTTVTG
ncbi:hypothetical protein [Catenuloplanes indicus]|uniref:Uncharacterized protein n=1 Tax=Catenuloplanes indicus TaxID=137267 RepID=A0AAE3W040_9ACTN|nr:hypothetical protein [Catenuloplanes indicus]MDQ0366860.1 hypothetical protein [Catenuloplanes indicus]